MRVIAGTAKGHKLKVPKGGETRPPLDRQKEALFSMLAGKVDAARRYGGDDDIGVNRVSLQIPEGISPAAEGFGRPAGFTLVPVEQGHPAFSLDQGVGGGATGAARAYDQAFLSVEFKPPAFQGSGDSQMIGGDAVRYRQAEDKRCIVRSQRVPVCTQREIAAMGYSPIEECPGRRAALFDCDGQR